MAMPGVPVSGNSVSTSSSAAVGDTGFGSFKGGAFNFKSSAGVSPWLVGVVAVAAVAAVAIFKKGGK